MRPAANFGLLALGAALLVVGLPRTARAQEARPQSGFWTVEASGGIALPMASLKDLEKAGPAAGVGLSYWFTPGRRSASTPRRTSSRAGPPRIPVSWRGRFPT